MSQPITIENDAIQMDVWPQLGGKVSSIVDKADGYQLLFNYPAEIRTDSNLYGMSYADSWYAGWDECFPGVGAGPYPNHPYDGIRIPDHGELWALPAVAVPTRNGITTVWHGLRFGYRLTRKLWLDGPKLSADYTLVNLAPFPFRFVWAQHALMSMLKPVDFELPSPSQFHLLRDAADPPTLFDWPRPAPDEDLSHPDTLPTPRSWKVFSLAPISDPLTIHYPSRDRTLQLHYHSDDALAAYWGMWINCGGWAGHRHFALEPTTGRFDWVDRSIKDASAGQVDPMATVTWSVRWTLGK